MSSRLSRSQTCKTLLAAESRFQRLCRAHTRLARTIASVTITRQTQDEEISNRRLRVNKPGRCLRSYTTERQDQQKENGTVLDVLEQRGLINQLAGDQSRLQKLLSAGSKPGAYCGVDATAKSLHVGHMVPFMALFWMCLYGHTSISLVGGATCRIGDPTGRLTSRTALANEDASTNIESIKTQLQRLWRNVEELASRHDLKPEFMNGKVLNNEAWAEVGFLTLLRKLGTGFRLGAMLAKDTVRNKMEKGDGMSYAEFSYPLMQAWDWWHLYNSSDNVRIQIGGSDQYGNITAGIDAVNHMRQGEGRTGHEGDVLGFTVPLLTTSSGEKFGKSAGNAVWLDKTLMDPFALYQYFVSIPDADVDRLLKFFTFLPLDTIAQIMTKHSDNPSRRLAQHTLAFEFVALVHCIEEARTIQERQKAIFNKDSSTEEILQGAPSVELPAKEVWNEPLAKILCKAGLAASNGAAGRLILNGGVYIGSDDNGNFGWTAIPADKSSLQRLLVKDDALSPSKGRETELLLLRTGKTNIRAVSVTE